MTNVIKNTAMQSAFDTVNTKTLNGIVQRALNSTNTYTLAIEEMRNLLKAAAKRGQMSRDALRDVLLRPVASYYSVPLVAKERGEGMTMDKDSGDYEAARKARSRLMNDILGKTSNHTEDMEVPASVLKAAKELVRLTAMYEHSAKLLATAVAAAKAA